MRAAPQRGAAWWVLSLPARQEAGRLQWSAELWSAPGGGQSLHLGFIGRLHWAQGCLHPRPTPLLDGARHPIPTYRPHPPPTFQVPRGLCGRLPPALPAAPLGRRWVAALWVLVCPGGSAGIAPSPFFTSPAAALHAAHCCTHRPRSCFMSSSHRPCPSLSPAETRIPIPHTPLPLQGMQPSARLANSQCTRPTRRRPRAACPPRNWASVLVLQVAFLP